MGNEPDIIEGIVTEKVKVYTGNGERASFADVPKHVLDEYRAKGVESRKRNAAAKKLMERAAYLEAHREHAATILGGRLAVVEGLLTEMLDPATGKPDTQRLDTKRLQLLQTILNDFDKHADMLPGKESETQRVDVNVTHAIEGLVKKLGGGA